MKILYINTYFWGGGAEKVARQLYFEMTKRGEEVFFLAGRLQKNIPEDVNVVYSDFIGRFITTVTGSMLSNNLVNTIRAKNEIIKIIKEKHIDIVHFHNLHGNYLGIFDLQEIRQYCKNIVITLHDMWLLTGCCPYSLECEEWNLSQCESCMGNDLLMGGKKYAKKILEYKKRNYAAKKIQFVTPADWLKKCCQKSYLRSEDIRLIHNGINLEKVLVWDKEEIRRKYRLPLNKYILLFAANGIRNQYKGFRYLQEALWMLEEKARFALLVIGNKEKEKLDLPFDIYDMGYIRDESVMNEIYSAADLFILPSIADVFPLTMLEAMASGTPVLAFATGGIPEAVTEEVGWLVERRNSQELANMIRAIFSDIGTLKEKSQRCRTYMESKFKEREMIDKYESLYNELLNERV